MTITIKKGAGKRLLKQHSAPPVGRVILKGFHSPRPMNPWPPVEFCSLCGLGKPATWMQKTCACAGFRGKGEYVKMTPHRAAVLDEAYGEAERAKGKVS